MARPAFLQYLAYLQYLAFLQYLAYLGSQAKIYEHLKPELTTSALSSKICMQRATEKHKWARAVKWKPKALRHFKSFKIDETVYEPAESMWYPLA